MIKNHIIKGRVKYSLIVLAGLVMSFFSSLGLTDADESIQEHSLTVLQALQLSNGNILSRGDGNLMFLWDANGTYLKTLYGHSDRGLISIRRAIELDNTNILSWGRDGKWILWDNQGDLLLEVESLHRTINGISQLLDGSILSWGTDGISIWDINGVRKTSIDAPNQSWVIDVIQLNNNNLLAWFRDNSIKIFDLNGNLLTTLLGHTALITGIIQNREDYILSWSIDETIRVWDAEGNPIHVLSVPQAIPPANAYSIRGVKTLNNQNILSWGDFGNYLWDEDGNIINSFGQSTLDIIELQNGFLLAREYSDVSMYDEVGNLILDFDLSEFPKINGILELQDGHILTWFNNGSIKIFDTDGTVIADLIGHTDSVFGTTQLNNGYILSWGYDTTLRLWDIEGNSLAIMGTPKSR